MRTIAVLFLAGAVGCGAHAQYDIGAAAGGVLTFMSDGGHISPHQFARVDYVDAGTFSAAVFFRTRKARRVNPALDLVWSRRSFRASYGQRHGGGGTTKRASADLDQLYVGIVPELALDSGRRSVFRLGMRAGICTDARAQGTVSTWSNDGEHALADGQDLGADFRGDLRVVLGFGYRLPWGARWAVHVDPELTYGIGSLLKDDWGRLHGWDVGLRVGIARAFAH
ncbi:MAG: hypothetical protein KDB93_06640 [Flavobacteriales bacterium]|nr:hypothetical protein [Flavobacteriales bacterium]